MTEDVEYHGLVAQTWDLLRGDTSSWPDRGFYLRVIEAHGEPVLDVGCGTGRLLLDYLAHGVDVDGVDVSEEMLALCRARAAERGLQARLYRQRMEAMSLPRRYRTIMVPSSSLQLLVDEEAAAQAMQRFREHLEPRGALVMPFMLLGGDVPGTRLTSTEEAIRPEDGALVRRRSHARYDPTTHLEHTEDVYEVIIGGRIVASERHVRSPATRSYTAEQACALFEAAGLTVERVASGFADDPHTVDDRLFTVVGVRD